MSDDIKWYNVKVTRELLDKDPKSLTEAEKEAVDKYYERLKYYSEELDKANEELQKNCPILCSGIVYKLIPSYGWIQPVTKMAYKLEKLNLEYEKHNMKVTFDQTKEKFGTFRGYYSIDHSLAGIFSPVVRMLEKMTNWLDSLDYGYVTVVDTPDRHEFKWDEIDEHSYENHLIYANTPATRFAIVPDGVEPTDHTLTYFKKATGKFYRSRAMTHRGKSHRKPTKKVVVWHLNEQLNLLYNYLSFVHKPTQKEEALLAIFDNEVNDLVRICEDECMKHCEICGAYFNDSRKDDHMCETKGWITYICRRCAEVRGGEFYDVVSKEQINCQKDKTNNV